MSFTFPSGIFGQRVSWAETACVNAMVEAIAQSGSPVKSQQLGEPELSLEERREELLRQYRSRPLVFLERYHVRAHFAFSSHSSF